MALPRLGAVPPTTRATFEQLGRFVSAGVLTLLRHGQSTANAHGLFTGILDVPLTSTGRREARSAAALLDSVGLIPGHIFVSELQRAKDTARIVTGDDRAVADWRLDERNYGALTGRLKADVIREYGLAQFQSWRRSVDDAPPAMGDELYDRLAATPLFRRLPAAALVRTESLHDVVLRVGTFFTECVTPLLMDGEDVLVVAHGNSLRALCSILDGLEDAAVRLLNLPTGQPLVYRFDPTLHPIVPGSQYLDEITATASAVALANEGGT